ncbi:MAG: deoxynucleoside kinase [Trueperaceae bacterium]
MYIAIAGNIGAGKSTLTKLLSERYSLTPVYETVDENPYLEDFYQDMPRYAFHSQMFFLAKRLEQHLKFINPGSRIIQDRTLYEDADIFAKNLFQDGTMNPRDYNSYRKMYEAILQALRPPDLLIYIRTSVPTLQAHICKRGREYEMNISPDYLERLNALYEDFIADYAFSDVVVIPGDRVEFVETAEGFAEVVKLLGQHGLTAPEGV